MSQRPETETAKAESRKGNKSIYYPSPIYCTDNAAMVAIAGYYKFLDKKFNEKGVKVQVKVGKDKKRTLSYNL